MMGKRRKALDPVVKTHRRYFKLHKNGDNSDILLWENVTEYDLTLLTRALGTKWQVMHVRQQFLSVEEALSTHCIPVTPEAAKASGSPQLDISHVSHGEGVKMVKEKLIPVLKKLKLIPNELKDLDSVAPLALPEQSSATATNGNKSRKVCSYKEMWKKDNAVQSLRTSALYEAGGSDFWMSCSPVDNLPLTAEGGAPGETDASATWPIHLGSWNQLTHAKALFDPSPHHHGRILFPVTLETAVKSPTDVVSPSGGEHPASLKLLCGHLILAAWWLAMREAIVASDNDRIGALFEAMLTVTIRVTLWVSDAHVMKVAMASAERTRALEVPCDNVITFADRLRIVVNDITSCDSVSMTHAKCLDKLRQDGVLWCLLTDGPTRLYRLIVSVVKFIDKLRLSPKPSVTDALEMLFSSLCLSLEAEAVTCDSVTTEFLTGKEKSSANDKPCWAAMCLMSIAVMQQARNVLALMEEATPDLKLVMETLLNPVLWRQEILKQSKLIQDWIDEICNATKIDTCQLYLTYRGKINKTTTRKVFGSQMNCESCFVALSDEFATEEKPTTAFVTYSNIPYPQNLPLINYDIKAKMLGLEKTPADEVKKPRDWSHGNNVPLFWSETKPVTLWQGLIENYLAAQVVDLSCSLALARACLKTGTKYVGVAMSPEHSQWAQNAVNQDAIRVICESGHCLHQSSLSELLQKHFADLCQEGKEEDGGMWECQGYLQGSISLLVTWCRLAPAAQWLGFTDQFICSMRIDVQAVERRAFAQMQIVVQESIRRKKRCHLSRANSITLSVDDKKPYRLVRYKACDTDGKIESGLLCVLCPLKVLMECDPEEWDEDKCVMAADSIADGIRGFCTPLGEGCNEILYSHIICNVRAFTADGAPYAQKTGRALKDRHCRNIVLIFRDACHMIRLARRDPLLCGDAYRKAWETLFGDKCPTPQLQYSPEWRARLSMLQHLLLADDTLGGILKSKLKHMSFAAQRWESSSTPQRRFCYLI
ncbi:Uncharacterized protein SCF082_LOCUS18214 [Durusdinium trenchii]|uniref:Uncharacterized protein n=1 Tax=Durusdinium trenchii TaxID=1381693 RepID=A0ABP0KNC6_9DINO